MAQPGQASDVEIWRGRPWVIPHLAIRTIMMAVFTSIIFALEASAGYLYVPALGVIMMIWTLIVVIMFWVLWISNLLIVRATNLYILRADSLEIRTGLLTTKNAVIVPTGFSDLEVVRSLSSRVFNIGDITIKTQSERDYTKKMVMVKDPMRVAELIRDVMARQIFKLDERRV